MAIDPSKLVGVGTTANDNTGDLIRDAFIKINDNFTELYIEPSITLVGNTLTLTRPDDSTSTVDLSAYLDDTAITGATIDGAGIATFTNSDSSTFTLDLSSLLDDTNLITSVNTQTGAVVLDSDDIAEGSTNLYNQTHTGHVTGDVQLTIENDVIDYDKLATEFTTSSVLTAAADVDMDFSAAQVFTMTSSIAVDINFTNAEIGQVKDLIVTDSGGTSSLTFDTTSNTITTIQGTYSATAGAVNFIQVVCTAANTFFLSISQSI